MEKYNKNIMEQNRHMFIYDDGIERQNYLTQLENAYPIKTEQYSPMAIYMDELRLPNVNNEEIDKTKIAILTREYLIYSIAYKILKKIYEQIDINSLNDRINNLSFWLEKNNSDIDKINELKQLLQNLEKSVNFYIESYFEVLKTGKFSLDFDKLPISYMNIEKFTKDIKSFLNNKSYFGIIINQQGQISLELQKAINWLITKRINSNISIKVFCQESNWETYYDLDGTLAENIHDYESVKIFTK